MDPGTAERRISNPSSFWLEARSQRVCAHCRKGGHFDAHHVVEKQLVKRMGKPQYDIRNALRLCDELGPNDCHGGQTSALRKCPLVRLTDENVEYAFEVLGSAAYDYLTRHYDGADPRVDAALAEALAMP